MFRMEFQSLDAVEEDEDRTRPYSRNAGGTRGTSVYEQYRQRKGTESSPPKIYEGRVGKFGKMQRVLSSNEAMSHLPPIAITRAHSLNSAASIPKDWVEVDLIDFSESPKSAPPKSMPAAPTTPGEQEVIRELVKPFAESVNLTGPPEPVIRDLLSNGVEETVETAAVSAGPEGLQVRTDSMRSSITSNSARSECSDTESTSAGERVHVKDEEKGSPATRSVNKAFNKLMHKKNKPTVPEAKFVKPWDEPLLLVHEQVKVERKARKEAKAEAKRLAEESKREVEIRQRELLELANPVPESSLKHQKEHGFSKGIHKLFHIHGAGIHSNSLKDPSPREGMSHGMSHADVRESKLVMPRAGMFEVGMPVMSPSQTDVGLSQIRSGPRPVAKSDLTFATVESNQRDVQPWTMEEYMAHNARLGEWEEREDDEEFGGIEGNQLLNQYFDDDNALDNLDSDSD